MYSPLFATNIGTISLNKETVIPMNIILIIIIITACSDIIDFLSSSTSLNSIVVFAIELKVAEMFPPETYASKNISIALVIILLLLNLSLNSTIASFIDIHSSLIESLFISLVNSP